MVTKYDERVGLVKVYWDDIRERVKKVEPRFAQIVDQLSPDKSFPLYLAYYPYGALKGDTYSTFLPKMDGGFYRLSDPNAPADVIKHLGYGTESAPLAMLLEKNLELFIDLPDEGVTIPRTLYKPGSFFPFARILSRRSTRTYASNGVLTLTSGARSTFMLPNIGCATNHVNLQRDYNVRAPVPKTLYEHWFVFKDIANSNAVKSNWRSCLMYFSHKWLDKIETDKSWQVLKLHMHELAWQYYEYQRNYFFYDVVFSLIQRRRNLKPNPYLADTAKHLFITALGEAPGYTPAIDNEALPIDILQEAFTNSYDIKKYFATILQPSHYNFETAKHPIYYSLQYPSAHSFSPKSRQISSTLTDMRELEHIVRIFSEELCKTDGLCSDTIISKVAAKIKFNYFHNKSDRHQIIKPSTEIPSYDNRFVYKAKSPLVFASDAPFVRGCISMGAV